MNLCLKSTFLYGGTRKGMLTTNIYVLVRNGSEHMYTFDDPTQLAFGMQARLQTWGYSEILSAALHVKGSPVGNRQIGLPDGVTEEARRQQISLT